MSLVYDENSDEIRCVLRVNIHETEVCVPSHLTEEAIKFHVAMRVRESMYMRSPKSIS